MQAQRNPIVVRPIAVMLIIASIGLYAPPTVSAEAWTTEAKLICLTQERLAELGWDPGPADGRMGDKTRDAISRYQRYTKATVTGEATVELLGRLLLPCQTRLTSDWYGDGTVTSQFDFGCENPQAVAIATSSDRVTAGGGPTCGRARCTPPTVSPARHAQTPLRFDGLYRERDGQRYLRFYPDGTVISAVHFSSDYEVACALTREALAKTGSSPQTFTISDGQVRFQDAADKKLRAMSATATEAGLQVGYDEELALFVTPRWYEFLPDPR